MHCEEIELDTEVEDEVEEDFDEAEAQCWLWSLIIFLIQRSLFSAVFIPHEDFTP
jgi:hypothetical protein